MLVIFLFCFDNEIKNKQEENWLFFLLPHAMLSWKPGWGVEGAQTT